MVTDLIKEVLDHVSVVESANGVTLKQRGVLSKDMVHDLGASIYGGSIANITYINGEKTEEDGRFTFVSKFTKGNSRTKGFS